MGLPSACSRSGHKIAFSLNAGLYQPTSLFLRSFFFYIVMKARQDDTIVSIMVLFSSQLFCLMLALVAKIFSLLELAVCGWLQTGISAPLVLKFSFDSRVLNKTSTWERISDMKEYNPQCEAFTLYKLMQCRGATLHAFELHSGRVHEQ